MKTMFTSLKKSLFDYDDHSKNMIDDVPLEVRFLVDELLELDDLSAPDWKEIHEYLLHKLPQLHSYSEVLATIYRAVELRSDFITANRVAGKFARRIRLLFRKTEMARLSGDRNLEANEYYVPTFWGIWLFEQLINPFDRAEIEAKTAKRLAELGQLSLTSFLGTSRRGVRI